MLGWDKVINEVVRMGPHRKIKIRKELLPRPEEFGFKRSVGLKLNMKHYRLRLPGGACVHVEEDDDYYSVHVDFVDPSANPLAHLKRDSPLIWTVLCAGGGATLGAILERALSRKSDSWRKGGIAGAMVGMIAGIISGDWIRYRHVGELEEKPKKFRSASRKRGNP